MLEVNKMLLGKEVRNLGFLDFIFEALFTNGKHMAVLIVFNCSLTVLFFCGLVHLHS
jgi:hypothetical protein